MTCNILLVIIDTGKEDFTVSSLIESLYQYAEEHAAVLCSGREVRDNRVFRDRHLAWLRAHLDAESLRHLEEYREHQLLVDEDEARSLFRFSLSMGVQLGALRQLPE